MAHDAKHRKSRKGGAAKMILIVLLIAFWYFMMNKQAVCWPSEKRSTAVLPLANR